MFSLQELSLIWKFTNNSVEAYSGRVIYTWQGSPGRQGSAMLTLLIIDVDKLMPPNKGIVNPLSKTFVALSMQIPEKNRVIRIEKHKIMHMFTTNFIGWLLTT